MEAENLLDHIVIRKAEEGDLGFIKATWIDSYRSNRINRGLAPQVYSRGMWQRVERILRSPGTHVGVAAFKLDPEIIVGWLCWKKGSHIVYHYAYTKKEFGRQGLIKAIGSYFDILPELGIDSIPAEITHLPKFPLPRGWIFNPFGAES